VVDLTTKPLANSKWALLNDYVSPTPIARTSYRLVSADSHVNEPPDLWTSRVPARFRDRAPRMERFGKGHGWVLEGSADPIPFGRNACAGLGPFEGDPWITWEEVRPGGWDPAARLREQDVDGVDAEVLFPTPRISYSIIANHDGEFHLALVRAYNDWLSEYAGYAPARLAGMALLPNRGVAMAVAEVERAAQLPGIRGFLMGLYPDGNLDMTPECEPLWDAIEASGMPLTIHVTLTDTHPGAHRATLREGVSRFVDAPGRIEEFIYGGVLQRHPRLRLVFVEVDAGWVPYFKEQADNRWLRNSPKLREQRNLTERPSSYFDRIAFTYITDRFALRNRRDIGIDSLMWSSDYPHGGSDYPLSWRMIEGDFADIPAGERHAILAGNAVRIFGLDTAR
jgi:predicted TIM-barrel fold metal-dependent hydrolase